MDAVIHASQAFDGRLSVPQDKAICHRAALAAALASGRTEIAPWPIADDCQRTLRLIRGLGVTALMADGALTIEGRGPDGLKAPQAELPCGESGTTMRLAAGVLAGQPFASTLAAAPSLARRPMRRIVEPLTRMGASIMGDGGAGEVYPPLRIRGKRPLKAIRYEVPVASAQVKSAILFAGLFGDGPTTVIEPHATRDHTERLLRRCGVRLRAEGRVIAVEPGPLTAPGRLAIPGDFSSAAFFLVAGACVPGARIELQDVGLNPTRTALLEVLKRMGAAIQVEETAGADWEPLGRIRVAAQPLVAVTVDPADVPGLIDELPVLMVAAACATGTTRLLGIGELRVKETDRIQSMVDGLSRLGASIRAAGRDTVEIAGGPLSGATVNSVGDHRTAMSLAIAGLVAKGTTTIRGAQCVAKSFPEFFGLLAGVAGSSTVKTVDSA